MSTEPLARDQIHTLERTDIPAPRDRLFDLQSFLKQHPLGSVNATGEHSETEGQPELGVTLVNVIDSAAAISARWCETESKAQRSITSNKRW